MDCHGNNNNSNGKGKGNKGALSHMIMMALCCGAPIIILLLVPFLIKIGASGLAKPLAVIVPFICPLMMVFMMSMMFKGRRDKTNTNESHQNVKPQLDQKTQEEYKK